MNSCRPYKTKDMRETANDYIFYAPGPFWGRLIETDYWLDFASATASHTEGKCVIECVTTDTFFKETIRSQHYCIGLHKSASTELARSVRKLDLGFTPEILVDTKACNIINVLEQSSRQSDPSSTQPVQYHAGAKRLLYNKVLSPRYRRCASRNCRNTQTADTGPAR